MITNKNFSNLDPIDIPVDTEYFRCNFSRNPPIDIGGGVMRGIRLFPGDDTSRAFTQCNLTNCESPPNSILIECNTHIVDISQFDHDDIVTVDGQEVSRKTYTNMVHYGRYNPITQEYDDNPTPVVTPND